MGRRIPTEGRSMNPLVQEMLTAKNRQDLEIEMLEELLQGDVKCESAHETPCTICSVDVVARKHIACDGVSFSICENSRRYNSQSISNLGICDGCDRPCIECWTITPI